MSTSSLKKVNLQQMQRPKTLIVIHYKGKRVSIPLFQSFQNITEYLYHQLHKFQVTVLENQSHHKHKQSHVNASISNLVCFSVKEQDKNKLDLKMNILLSMSRLTHDEGRSRLDLKYLDITSYYKFMEIQPYYGNPTKELIPQYHLFSILSSSNYSTTYLGRRISDGRFYSIKFWRAENKLAQKEFGVLKILHEEQAHIINKWDLELIPQIQQVRKTQGFFIFITQFCPGGSLRDYLKSKQSDLQCLHFMKQLIWGVYSLHEKYNFIHRALCLENIWVDFVGNLRLFNYQNCQPCYSSNYLINSHVPQSYEQNYIIDNVVTPPEVCRSVQYNNLVDYYGVGAVLYEIYNGCKPNSDRPKKKNERQGIQIAIQSLMSDNLRDRELFANQIISELHEQKMKKFSNSDRSCLENERLTLNKIQIGKSINIQEYMNNGIQHQEAIKIMKPSHDDQIYYLNPIRGKKKSKSKEKSKSKTKSKDKDKMKVYKQKSIISEGKKSISSSKKSIPMSSSQKQKSQNKKLDNSIQSKKKTIKTTNKSETSKSKQKIPKPKDEKKVIPNRTIQLGTTSVKSPPRSRVNHHPPQQKSLSKTKIKF